MHLLGHPARRGRLVPLCRAQTAIIPSGITAGSLQRGWSLRSRQLPISTLARATKGDSRSALATVDETENLLDALDAQKSEVLEQPKQVVTPAAVWLPYGKTAERLAEQGGASLTLVPNDLANWFLYQTQKVLTGPLPIKLAGYFAVGIPLVLGCAVLYSWASGKPLVDGLVQSYGNLYKVPGTVVLGDVNLASTLVNNFVFFLGTFTFALVLGVITDEVSIRYQQVREGNYPVQARGHTLVLNYNNQLAPLLRQMQVAKAERGAFIGPVVVLAERDKQEMDQKLLAACGRTMDITTRNGPPTSTRYLDRAAAVLASTVVVLTPTGGDRPEWAAERQVASLLALKALRERARSMPGAPELPPQTVILQSPAMSSAYGSNAVTGYISADGSQFSLASTDDLDGDGRLSHPVVAAARNLMLAAGKAVEFADMDLEAIMCNNLAQSAAQPGVASVYCNLVQQTHAGAELYIRRFPELVGLSYREVRRRFSHQVVVGYIDEGEVAGGAMPASLLDLEEPTVRLNPCDDEVLGPGASLLLVARTGENIKPTPAPLEVQQPAKRSESSAPRSPKPPRPRRVFVVEWGASGESQPSHQVMQLLSHLKAWLPPDSSITVVGPAPPRASGNGNGSGGSSGSDADPSSRSGMQMTTAQQLQQQQQPAQPAIIDPTSSDGGSSSDAGNGSASAASSGIVTNPVTNPSSSSSRSSSSGSGRPLRSLQLRFLPSEEGGSDVPRLLAEAGLPNADAVVVLSASTGEDDKVDADADFIAALVVLEDLVRGREVKRRPLHVLGAVHFPDTVQVANYLIGSLGGGKLTAELLQPDELAAGVLTQLAAEPLLRHVLAGFMASHRGPTIRTHSAAKYGLWGSSPVPFSSVAEVVRAKGDTAVGYISSSGSMILGPPAAEERVYGPGDRVVVLGG